MSVIELTDITSVRQFMQKSLSDKLQDEDLEVLIRQASEEIQRFCNREFLPAKTETRSFELVPNTNPYELLDLAPYEYRAIKKVTVDPDLETPVVLTAVQYRPWPYPARDGTFFGIRLAELPEPAATKGLENSPVLPYQTRRVDVEAEWGLGAIPQGLQHWANVTVEAWCWLRRGVAQPAQASALSELPSPVLDDLPGAVQAGLKRRWVRPVL